ncbi:UNKNOWN [Stylonychia lemnae]|uniref:Uncharacterized protein n=1 Tax=Stylonychia lemnae TaxID=5949 RepID=A0A077ZRD3_STYLE|nr:UNKNOWN [Stylonychia lemnae]|eukprot:CDW72009.1 UNKNOWN [Stylonychia lemnae]
MEIPCTEKTFPVLLGSSNGKTNFQLIAYSDLYETVLNILFISQIQIAVGGFSDAADYTSINPFTEIPYFYTNVVPETQINATFVGTYDKLGNAKWAKYVNNFPVLYYDLDLQKSAAHTVTIYTAIDAQTLIIVGGFTVLIDDIDTSLENKTACLFLFDQQLNLLDTFIPHTEEAPLNPAEMISKVYYLKTRSYKTLATIDEFVFGCADSNYEQPIFVSKVYIRVDIDTSFRNLQSLNHQITLQQREEDLHSVCVTMKPINSTFLTILVKQLIGGFEFAQVSINYIKNTAQVKYIMMDNTLSAFMFSHATILSYDKFFFCGFTKSGLLKVQQPFNQTNMNGFFMSSVQEESYLPFIKISQNLDSKQFLQTPSSNFTLLTLDTRSPFADNLQFQQNLMTNNLSRVKIEFADLYYIDVYINEENQVLNLPSCLANDEYTVNFYTKLNGNDADLAYKVQTCLSFTNKIFKPLKINFRDKCIEGGILRSVVVNGTQFTYYKTYPAIRIPLIKNVSKSYCQYTYSLNSSLDTTRYASIGSYSFSYDSLLIYSDFKSFIQNDTFVFQVQLKVGTELVKSGSFKVNMKIENCFYSEFQKQQQKDLIYKIGITGGIFISLQRWKQSMLSCPVIILQLFINEELVSEYYPLNPISYNQLESYIKINTSDESLADKTSVIRISGSNTFKVEEVSFNIKFKLNKVPVIEEKTNNLTAYNINHTPKTIEKKDSVNKVQVNVISLNQQGILALQFSQKFKLKTNSSSSNNTRQLQIIDSSILKLFKIIFPNPKNVSAENDYDTLEVIFSDTKQGSYHKKQTQVRIHNAPNYLGLTQLAGETISKVGTSMAASFSTNIALSVFLGVSLKNLWTLMNTLQIFIYYPLLEIGLQSNVIMMITQLKDVVNLNFIPKDFLSDIFGNIYDDIDADPVLQTIDIFQNFQLYF